MVLHLIFIKSSLGKGKESNPTNASANTLPTHHQHPTNALDK